MTRISAKDYARLKLRDGAQPEPTPRRGVMNKWELSFLNEVLKPKLEPGEVCRYEALTLTLYDGSSDVRKARYTPDFLVATPGYRVRLYEVKGRRDRAGIEKLKNAAQQYPCFMFILATGGPGRWECSHL